METPLDWTSFKRQLNIKAQAVKIWNSWASAQGLESWFLESARFFDPEGGLRNSEAKTRPGDTYEWKWFTYPDYYGTGKVIDVVKNELIRFTFDVSIVEVKISENEDVSGECIVSLTQSEIPIDEASKMRMYVGCSGSWMYHMTNLKSVLEGGLDLRGKTTPGMFNN